MPKLAVIGNGTKLEKWAELKKNSRKWEKLSE
jgi:hypothetical protein